MVKLQVKDEKKVKYEVPEWIVDLDRNDQPELIIKYAIANELAELNRTMKTVKMSLMNMSQVSSDQFYKRS